MSGQTASTLDAAFGRGVRAELQAVIESVQVTAGTVEANKSVVAGASKQVDTLTVTTLKVGATPQTLISARTLSPAAAGSNVCEVTITAVDGAGATIAGVWNADVWLSDAASGAGLTGTTASGTVTAKAASGIVLATYTAKKAIRVQSLATGIFVLEITDSAKTGFYVTVQNATGGVSVSAQLVAGNHG